jgi:hypothetical protein
MMKDTIKTGQRSPFSWCEDWTALGCGYRVFTRLARPDHMVAQGVTELAARLLVDELNGRARQLEQATWGQRQQLLNHIIRRALLSADGAAYREQMLDGTEPTRDGRHDVDGSL